MTNDPWDWAGIEDAYVNGDMSPERIADAFGLSASTIRRMAKDRGWVRLVGTKPLRLGRPRRLPGSKRQKLPSATERRRREMVDRLLSALDKGLGELEARMTTDGEDGGARSAADAERDARTLTGLTRLYAKLVELDEQARGAAAKGAKADEKQGSAIKEATQDAERFRQELALRLQRLNQARDA